MNKNIIISSIVASALVAWMVWFSVSADEWYLGKDIQKKWENLEDRFDFDEDHDFKKGRKWFMKGLTTEEKTSLKSMSDEEKKLFFETKKAERKAEKEAKKIERQAHDNVIDKLLAWETLTSTEETLRSEIIEKRAERKAKKEAMEQKKEEFKTIIEKKKAWEDLTEEEKNIIKEMKSKFKDKKKRKR